MVSVFGIGNPLMDVVAHVDGAVVDDLGTRRGTMNLVDAAEQERILQRATSTVVVPGGSCANTMRGVAWLAGEGDTPGALVFSGGVGSDDVADHYAQGLRWMGVQPSLAPKGSPTGRSVILVTPDHERTMFTFLGACREYGPTDVDHTLLSSAGLLHITGYMWDTKSQKQAVRDAVDAAGSRGALVSFDVADPFVVQRYREEFLSWIPGKVDVLFANREELTLLTGAEGGGEAVISAAGRLAPHVVMKTGGEGCLVHRDGRLVSVPGYCVPVVDTTAAGDSFAAGYVYGLLRGMETTACACLANGIAAGIVGVEGCDYTGLDRGEVLSAAEDPPPETRRSGQ